MLEEWFPSPNFGSRYGRNIIAIVDHVTAGDFPGCLSWFQSPTSKVSAHYLITKAGRIIQLVKEGNAAYHAGIRNNVNWSIYDGTNPNAYTIGIEHEGQPGEELTEEQYQATLFLHKELTAKYNIPIDSEHIIGHYRIDSVNRPNCPGSAFPWDRLFNDLKGVPVPPTPTLDPDVNLVIWCPASKANEAIKKINEIGYYVEQFPLKLRRD